MGRTRYFGIVFRLAIVVGLCAGIYAYYQANARRGDEYLSLAEAQRAYKCAAAKSDQELWRFKNSMENFDLGKVGCASRPFWASQSEIERVRAGDMSLVTPIVRGIDPMEALVALIAGFLSVLVGGSLIWGAWATLRWVWGRPNPK